ncbi:MAG: hypothetical protein IPK62_09305 [Bacteroidetes bacterium]|nr:hypothetical protein [Bacteroidota bacterium]MBK8145169.1 hypothetical protein [Bacteroidota bacterium]
MRYFLFLILITIGSNTFSQHLFKPILEVDFGSEVNRNDTTVFYIKRIDTSTFRKLISEGNKFAVQLWQPWCSGIIDLMPSMHRLKKHLNENGYRFVLISDRKEGLDYLKIAQNKVGKIAYFFNTYQINFESYQVAAGEELDDYKRIISEVTRKKVNLNYFCFLLNGGQLDHQNYSQAFYKKMLK